MPRSASLVLALLGGALAAAACYSERPAPPGFRYTCASEGDCRSNEACIEGLCQVTCTQATAAQDCTGSDHLLCFNGVCTSGCQVDDEHCPEQQECLDLTVLGIEIDVGGGGFIGSGSGPTGLCANFCDDGNPSACPDGEVCFEGFCVATCDDSSTCQQPLSCQGGFCLPDMGETSGGDTAAASSSSSSEGAASSSESGGTETTTGGVL